LIVISTARFRDEIVLHNRPVFAGRMGGRRDDRPRQTPRAVSRISISWRRGAKWGCKRLDRIYPDEREVARPPFRRNSSRSLPLPRSPASGRSRTPSRGFKTFEFAFYLAAGRFAHGSARVSQTRGCVVIPERNSGGTVSARHCRPLVYEPGVRFCRGDSILLATIYSAKDLYAHIRAWINSGRYPPRGDWITCRAFLSRRRSRLAIYSRRGNTTMSSYSKDNVKRNFLLL